MRNVLVLCYHGVSERWPADISIAPETLERQVGGLLRAGYGATTFTEAVIAPPHRRTLAVTFDDAYRSVRDIAFPILQRLGVTATVFAPTAQIDSGAPMLWPGIDHWLGTEHEHELVGMGWDGLAELGDAGWEVGSHSVTHPHLARIGDEALADELDRSRAAITDRLGAPCRSVAYPYGNVDARVIAAARAAGYEAAGAVSSHRAPSALDWPRVGVWRRDAGRRFALKASPLAQAARRRLTRPRYPDE